MVQFTIFFLYNYPDAKVVNDLALFSNKTPISGNVVLQGTYWSPGLTSSVVSTLQTEREVVYCELSLSLLFLICQLNVEDSEALEMGRNIRWKVP